MAAASGNRFGYVWADELNSCDISAWVKAICQQEWNPGLDGLFLMQRPDGGPWCLDHWDSDGSKSFCSNGSRAALAVPGAPEGTLVEAVSNGERILLKRTNAGAAIRMPEGESCGLRPVPMAVPAPAGFGWIGNPQLILRVPSVAAVDLATLAPPLRHHVALPGGTNVSVVEVLAPGEARIRSWERGVEGETLCCGTGCAVAAAWLASEGGPSEWTLHPAGGAAVTLSIGALEGGAWRDLWLSGPVHLLGTRHLDVPPSQGIHS